jgi:hypothetical protein
MNLESNQKRGYDRDNPTKKKKQNQSQSSRLNKSMSNDENKKKTISKMNFKKRLNSNKENN